MKIIKYFYIIIPLFLITACITINNKLMTDITDPLKEYVLKGSENEKIAIIAINGTITDTPDEGLRTTSPSMVQEIISQLKLVEKDKDVKAIILKINSPGGTITASDIIYHELMQFKKRTNKKIIVCMMDIAASGGYYISLPADYIIAHPTTITGSIGAIFIHPDAKELLDKIGLDMKVTKSGVNKDIASPFRNSLPDEKRILQNLINQFGNRFINLVVKHRKLNVKITNKISTANIYIASQAKKLKLIDQIGYMQNAIKHTQNIAKLSKKCKIIVYRRSYYPDDNIYNVLSKTKNIPIINFNLTNTFSNFKTGFYYFWDPAFLK